ncbi:MAG: hypothetical protein HQK75_09185 [Candidatus Magnetomorum sp.]|nr:hypothetical protein [Candidatus Magnetomorum sp.]
MAKKNTTLTEDSDPYVDLDPTFEQTVQVVEVTDDKASHVSLKKIFILLFLLLILVFGGISGVYFLFYGNPPEYVADNWNTSAVITKKSDIKTQEPSESTSLTLSTSPQALTAIAHQSMTIVDAVQSLTMNTSGSQAVLNTSTLQDPLNASNMQETIKPSNAVTQTVALNALEPITPNLRTSPVFYHFKIVSDSEDMTSAEDSDDITSTDESDDIATSEDSEDVTETKEITSATTTTAAAPSVTETESKDADKSKQLAAIPLGQRKKPIIFRSPIPLILMYPELTLNFNSFLVLLPDKPSNTFINIGVSLKTSNESVFKEIQDRKTFVRGAIFGILKRLFESMPEKEITGENIKKRIIKDINYLLINGTVDDVYITNYLTI